MKTEFNAPDAKVCPFCGHLPTIQPWHGGGPQTRSVGCDNDYCQAGPQVVASTRRGALAIWNTRYGR